MIKYHRLLNRQIKKHGLDKDMCSKMIPFLEQVNTAYIEFDNDLQHAETILENNSQELFLINKKLKSNIASISNRLSKVAGNIQEVIFEVDLKGNWKYLNPAWEKLTGYKTQDCIGKPFYKYLEDKEGKTLLRLLNSKQPKSNNFSKTINVITKEGIEKWLDISLKAITNEKDVYEGYIGTIVDISELKRYEFELLEAREKEKLANNAKDDFLSTMSHEIRTPLNAVIGISNLLLIEDPKPEQTENLEVLKHSSEHLLGLVNDILDFNKIASGSLELDQSEMSMGNVLDGIQSIFRTKAKAKNIRFTIKKDNSLPDFLIGDSIRISQILTNLVNNAIKFTEQGKVTLDIEVAEQTKDSCVLAFEVSDTGIGIPPDKQTKIFSSFAQANTYTTKKYGGTGLGLAICKRLVEIMGGELSVESEVDRGSTFRFYLNLKKVKSIKTGQVKQIVAEGGSTVKQNLKDIRVLVAEDNLVNTMVIKKFLAKWQADFEIVENGQIAFWTAKQEKYDLILMDLQMPVMNGFEASKLIRESDDSLNRNTPIYALTASAGIDIKTEIEKFKIDGIIQKPFNPDELLQKLLDISGPHVTYTNPLLKKA